MEIVLKVAPDFAEVVRSAASATSADQRPRPEALNVIAAFGATVHPMHETRRSGPLARYVIVDVADNRAEQLRSLLLRLEGVESATFMPKVELPAR